MQAGGAHTPTPRAQSTIARIPPLLPLRDHRQNHPNNRCSPTPHPVLREGAPRDVCLCSIWGRHIKPLSRPGAQKKVVHQKRTRLVVKQKKTRVQVIHVLILFSNTYIYMFHICAREPCQFPIKCCMHACTSCISGNDWLVITTTLADHHHCHDHPRRHHDLIS